MTDTPDVVQQIPPADLTIDSKNPALLANLKMLADMGAPALPDGITFQDYLSVYQGGVLPVHNTIFHAKVNGVWVDETMSDYLLVQFPIVAFDLLLMKGMITPGPGTPRGPIFQPAPMGDKPMTYDATKVINGTNPNPGNYGFPVTGQQGSPVATTTGVTVPGGTVPGGTLVVGTSTQLFGNR